MDVDDNKVYTFDSNDGLQVIDVSDPGTPARISSENFPAFAGIAVDDGIAYMADISTGLQVIDVSVSSNPTIIGVVNVPGWAYDVDVAGTYAYVADGYWLEVVDVNPASPTFLSIVAWVETTGHNFGVTVAGDYAYVADGEAGLQLVDISDPLNPSLSGSVDTPGYAYEVSVSGDYAYVADDAGGLQVIDVSVPASPAIVGAVDTPVWAVGVTVVGNTAYVSDFYSLQMIDISDPANPIIIGSVGTPGHSNGIEVVGNNCYAANGFSGLSIVPAPVELDTFTVMPDTEISVSLPSPEVAGNYTLGTFNSNESSELLGSVTFTGEINLLSSKAVIVAGGGPDADGEVWEETKAYANAAYQNLLYQGYRYEDIEYLTDETGAFGRTGAATKSELEAAIKGSGTGDLLLYLVDHGEAERFQLRGGADPEYVSATEVDQWLDYLQVSHPGGNAIAVYDGCKSGIFISKLIAPLIEQRVVLASTTPDQPAYFIDNNHSFSAHFWATLSGKSGDQASLSDAFHRAAANMAPYQTALVDANSNGVPNEDTDFSLLQGYTGNVYAMRREYSSLDRDKPVVAIVSEDISLAGTETGQLIARSVYDLDGDAIVRVWAEILPPDFNPDPEVTVKEVDSVELVDPDQDGVYEAIYSDFTVQGTYIITYYAKDAHGIYSLPRTSLYGNRPLSI